MLVDRGQHELLDRIEVGGDGVGEFGQDVGQHRAQVGVGALLPQRQQPVQLGDQRRMVPVAVPQPLRTRPRRSVRDRRSRGQSSSLSAA